MSDEVLAVIEAFASTFLVIPIAYAAAGIPVLWWWAP